MKDAEDAVRAVLEGLRDVEAPAGMERRVLLAMERQAAEGAGVPWWWRLAAGVAALAGVVGMAGLFGVAGRLLREPGAHHGLSVATTVGGPAVRAASPAEQVVPRRVVRVRMGVTRRVARRIAAGNAMDALAVSEMRAPSLVAPPLPLTEQERLLVRVARQGDPVELALLDPEARRRQEMDAKVEFQEFFEPAVTTTKTTKENR